VKSTSDEAEDLLAPWRQVAEKVDTFFDRAARNHADAIACKAGCDGCCQHDLSVTLAEALAALDALSGLPATRRAAIAARARDAGPPCALLDGEGRCEVYPGRPLICRSHGLPIREAATDGRASSVGACELNFGSGIEGYPKDATVNATLLTAGLTVADMLIARRLDIAQSDQRVGLRDLARRGRDALPKAAVAALPPGCGQRPGSGSGSNQGP